MEIVSRLDQLNDEILYIISYRQSLSRTRVRSLSVNRLSCSKITVFSPNSKYEIDISTKKYSFCKNTQNRINLSFLTRIIASSKPNKQALETLFNHSISHYLIFA